LTSQAEDRSADLLGLILCCHKNHLQESCKPYFTHRSFHRTTKAQKRSNTAETSIITMKSQREINENSFSHLATDAQRFQLPRDPIASAQDSKRRQRQSRRQSTRKSASKSIKLEALAEAAESEIDIDIGNASLPSIDSNASNGSTSSTTDEKRVFRESSLKDKCERFRIAF
jgi:hypothetical protein